MLPLSFIDLFTATLLQTISLTSEAVPELEELHGILCGFFKDDQPIDIPCVKADPIASIHYKFSEELESYKDDFIICMERIQSAFDNWGKILGIKPVEEDVESFLEGASLTDTSQDIE